MFLSRRKERSVKKITRRFPAKSVWNRPQKLGLALLLHDDIQLPRNKLGEHGVLARKYERKEKRFSLSLIQRSRLKSSLRAFSTPGRERRGRKCRIMPRTFALKRASTAYIESRAAAPYFLSPLFAISIVLSFIVRPVNPRAHLRKDRRV